MENPAAVFARANQNANYIVKRENRAAFMAIHAAFTVKTCLQTSMQTGKLGIPDFIMALGNAAPTALAVVIPGILLGQFLKPKRDISYDHLTYDQMHQHLVRWTMVPAFGSHLGCAALTMM